MLDEVFMLLRPAAQAKGVRLEWTGGEPDMRIEADPDKLKQILINLLDNAVKFGRPDTRVRVRAQAGPTGLRIEVEDEGPGVASEDAPHMFERFYRGQANGAPGSGLGLAIARNLARLHGGDIALASEPGQGSTFTLSLPAAAA
jgi:signal transduction histidine kinase